MKYIIANWKMNLGLEDVNKWLNEFEKKLQQTRNTIILSPSSIHLPIVSLFAEKHSNIVVAAQDISAKNKGAHTGEIGLFQIKDFCKYCIVGHSELRENTNTVLKKVKMCLENDIIPIVCSVNPLEELIGMNVIAWEDPKNISKDGVYNEKPVEEIEREIDKLSEEFETVIYGGSVNEKNSPSLAKIDKLSGVLIGNASLNPQTFWKIISDFEK